LFWISPLAAVHTDRLISGNWDYSSMTFAYPHPLRSHYEISVSPEPRDEPLEDWQQRLYTEIQPEQAFVGAWAQQFLPAEETQVPRLALRLKGIFEEQFAYSLSIENHGDETPLRTFLFDHREGHCELFASAAVLIFRAKGIPARLVTGFLLPEMDREAGYYHVTQASAHAWVEVYFDQKWQVFDPTPASPLAQDQSFFSRQLSRWQLMFQLFFMNWDGLAQQEAFSLAWVWLKTRPWSMFLWLGMALVLGVLLMRLGRRPTEEERFLAQMRQRFGDRLPGETWQAFLKRTVQDPLLRSALGQWLALLQTRRYSREKGDIQTKEVRCARQRAQALLGRRPL
jgi:hypothetical protein